MSIVAGMDQSKLTQIASSVHSGDMKYVGIFNVLVSLSEMKVHIFVDEELMCTVVKFFVMLVVQ